MVQMLSRILFGSLPSEKVDLHIGTTIPLEFWSERRKEENWHERNEETKASLSKEELDTERKP